MTSPNEILAREIRAAMQEQGVTAYKLSKIIGIGEAPLSRFFNGKQGLRDEHLGAILDYLRLEIAVKKRPGRKPER